MRRMKLGHIVLLGLLLALAFGATGQTLAFTSPLVSPLEPATPTPHPWFIVPDGCTELYTEYDMAVGHTTCNHGGVLELGLDVPPENWTVCAAAKALRRPYPQICLDHMTPTPEATRAPTATPTPSPTEPAQPAPAVSTLTLRPDLWMGRCKMWTDGTHIVKVECP